MQGTGGCTFENDVKEYGTQAISGVGVAVEVFENDVKEYGTQATMEQFEGLEQFENDVKEYGTQAAAVWKYDS